MQKLHGSSEKGDFQNKNVYLVGNLRLSFSTYTIIGISVENCERH